MLTGSRQSHCLSEIAQANDISELRQFLFKFCSLYGLANAVFHVTQIAALSQQNPLLLLTYPPEWVETYITHDYFAIDPVVQAGRNGFLPFDWSTLDLKSPQSISFFREAEAFDVGRYGLTLVVRGPHGERSLFTVTSNQKSGDWEQLRNSIIGDLQVIAYYLHEQSMIVSGLREQIIGRKLSKRETECLELLAHGLLPKQITSVLGISESAVRLYLSSGRRKLHVSTTNQAIAKAISLELIKS
ncbi:helix-turn-helix transcriptional regulator [Rhizobium sp. LEGMi135b]